ncbi:MAG: RluA family pseudouridine synthase [Flavobacteriaceae bacterium]|nr:RluA family pseudouridine synthase [Flavobacteriaceae bacterium]
MSTTKDNLQVLYEDNHVLIVNKRAGDPVQSDMSGDKPLRDVVMEYLKEKYNKPGNVFVGLVHRLDRPTSGIVVFAKTSKALTRLNESFRNKELKKTYWALVKNPVPRVSDTLVHYLVRYPAKNISRAFEKEVKESKKAILHYQILKSFDHYSLVEIDLETGRHHQIRAQFTAIGCPIRGDLKYGSKRPNDDGNINLHARKLEIKHPVKDELLSIVAPLPDEVLWNKC